MVTRFRRMLARMVEPLPLESDAERMAWLQDNLQNLYFYPNRDADKNALPYVVEYVASDKVTYVAPVASLREAIERLRRDPNYRQ